jgi:hypothetical protein
LGSSDIASAPARLIERPASRQRRSKARRVTCVIARK